MRGGVLDAQDLPAEAIAILGERGSQRIDALVHDLVERSAVSGEIVQSPEVGEAMSSLRDFMFEHVYLSADVTQERAKIHALVKALFDHYCDHPDEIPISIPAGELSRRVTDYIAGMTDRFAVSLFESIAVPTAFTS